MATPLWWGRSPRRYGPPVRSRSVPRAEGCVERCRGRVEREPSDELERLGSADQAVHAGVLPLDRDRALVADGVEHPEAGLPRHVAVAGRHEVPATSRVGPWQVRTHPAVAAVADLALRVLAVHVIDAVTEVPQEAHRVEVLPDEMAGVPVEPKRRPVSDRLQR